MEISSPTIDGKVCVTKRKTDSGGNNYAKYAEETNNAAGDSTKDVAVCGAAAVGTGTSQGVTKPEVFKDFVRVTLKGDGSKNWPMSTAGTNKDPKPETNDNAKAVATDLVALNPEEKTIVAGLLAKTIEGGEVVEIRTVSSTFVSI